MTARCRQRIAIAVAPWLVLAAGCVTLDVTKARDIPCGVPVQAAVTWQTYVLFAADPTHEGASTPGLAGRLFLFGPQADMPLVAAGNVQVRLYNDEPGAAKTEAPLEIWNLDPDTLKGKLQRDAIGWGYSLLLPWGTYRPDLTHIRLTVRFEPTHGGPALYAQETRLALHGQGPPAVIATTTAAPASQAPAQALPKPKG
jgi:hypothetical protein